MPLNTKKKKVIKAWWVRRGNEGFLISKVYMNFQNARIVAKGQDLDRTKISKSRAIPVEITFNNK